MPPFATLTSPAIPLFEDRIGTDFILARDPGSGAPVFTSALFAKSVFQRAAIMIVGRDFGEGPDAASAVAALKDMGLACLVGVSFAPSFSDCAFHQGLLTIAVEPDDAARLANEALSGDAITIDLARQTATARLGGRYGFALPASVRMRYLAFRDESLSAETGQGAAAPHLFVAARA